MQLQLPTTTKARPVLRGSKHELELIFDRALRLRHDDVVLRIGEHEMRRRETAKCLTPLGTTLGTTLGTDLGLNADALFALFRQGFRAGDSLFDASYYSVDGVSGKVAAFIDYIDPTHALAQGTDPNQVAIPAAYGAMAGALASSFLGSQFYDSNRAGTAWSYVNNGLGCELTSVLTPQSSDATFRVWLSTRTGVSVGFNVYRQGSTMTTVPLEITNGTAGISPASSILTATSVPTYWAATYSETASPEFSYYLKSAAGGSGASAAAPSAGSPASTLRMGAQVGGGSGFLAFWRMLIAHRRALSAAERTVERQYIQATTGIAP